MVLVTDKEYFMEKKLKEKLDLMIKRMTGKHQQDNLILIDGDEGIGKTNMAAAICGYVSSVTNRPLTIDNIFFDLDKLIDFTIKTKEQIIWWDEGALGGLASDWWNKNQKKFMKLLMVARKRRHFFVICIPKFFKLNEYFVVDRSIALIHVYARKNIHLGRFVYFNKTQKEYLFYDWKRSRKRNYKKFYSFHGSFVVVLGKIIDEEEYDKKKDEAILSIDNVEERIDKKTIIKEARQKAIKKILERQPKITQKELAEIFEVATKTIQRDFKKLDKDKETK